MAKARHILAVVAVTTALCADQVACAAPAAGPQVGQMAVRLMDRLSRPFRRTLPGAIRSPQQQPRSNSETASVSHPPVIAVVQHCQLSPFQFRLPPPVL